jgi:concentrative nucleoside transporter, CNT family
MYMQAIAGLVIFIGLAWLLSENRKMISFKWLAAGLALQFTVAAVLLNVPVFQDFFLLLNRVVLALEEATRAGTSFVFGYIGGAPVPFAEKEGSSSYIFALQSMPLILVIGALASLLFYWRILPLVVKAFAFVLQKTLNIGGALGLGTATTMFLGMIEAPLLIKPYLKGMTRSELFSLMTCGMASIAGTVMVLYATILKGVIQDPIGHILVASLIHIPAALTIARIMVPETGNQTTGALAPESAACSAMDALAKGTQDAISLLINIIAMLIVAVAIVSLVNIGLGLLPLFGDKPLTLQMLLGHVMAPVVWLFGIPWAEAHTAGALMGTKTVLNELLAFLDLAQLPPDALSMRSRLIMTYALCSFANFGSLGIMIGGLGCMAPERRTEVISLGIRSLVAGTLATCMTGAVVSFFV